MTTHYAFEANHTPNNTSACKAFAGTQHRDSDDLPVKGDSLPHKHERGVAGVGAASVVDFQEDGRLIGALGHT